MIFFQSSHKMYSNNIVNVQESATILNAYTKMSGNLFKGPREYIYMCVYVCVCVRTHPLKNVMVSICNYLCLTE